MLLIGEQLRDNLDRIHNQAAAMSPREWADLLVLRADEPVGDTPEMPPADVQVLTNSLHGRKTMLGGRDWYHAFRSLLSRNDLALERHHQLLDIGVGWGRMLRFLLRDLPVENMAGVDVQPPLVDACRQLLSGGHFALIEPRDPLPFPDAHFDFVVNNSLFSHLSVSQHLHTLDEIIRVMRPGGYLVSTVLTARHARQQVIDNPNPGRPWSQFEDPQELLTKLDNGEFAFLQTRKGRLSGYGLAIVPPAWIRTNWSPRIEVVDIDDQCVGQTLVLAHKRTDAFK